MGSRHAHVRHSRISGGCASAKGSVSKVVQVGAWAAFLLSSWTLCRENFFTESQDIDG